MLLKEFHESLAAIERPARCNDRQEYECHLAALFAAAGIDSDMTEGCARLLALAVDLYRKEQDTPLYFWADDRTVMRISTDTLPYDMRLATVLVPDPTANFTFALWELAERDNRLSLVKFRDRLPSPFGPDTPVKAITRSPIPSHSLFQDHRHIPFTYKPTTHNGRVLEHFMEEIPLQTKLMAHRFQVDPAVGR